jgi:hypothetical protein
MRKCIKTRFEPLQTFKNIFFQNIFLVVWKYAKMHQNAFLTTKDFQKYLMILVVWKYAKMPQNTFWTTSDVQKYLFSEHFSGGLEVCENASKRVFNHYRLSKNIFVKDMILVVWKYA